jgi:hypothetical protein
MLGRCLSLIILWSLSLSAFAIPSAEVISNLKLRMHPTISGGYLIKSFTNHTQSYIYDQALAIIAFSHHGDDKSAKKLLRGLTNLQKEDGSLYFSYYLDGKSPYPEEGDKRFAGAVAWVALAATTYQKIFKSDEFLNFNTLILKYLASQMRSVEINGKKVSAISFNPTDVPQTEWNENDVAALEHNLDAYSAFLHFSRINDDKKIKAAAADLKDFILAMWDESLSHFWSGANLKTGVVNKDEFYLDNQTWSLLALDAKTIKELNAKNALTMNCDGLLVEHEDVIGFMDTKPARRPAKLKFVWSEGTAGQILAMRKYTEIHNESISCKGQDFSTLLENIIKMKKKDGGIAYSTSTTNPDFTTASSVAGTAWYYFAANNINPFHLD